MKREYDPVTGEEIEKRQRRKRTTIGTVDYSLLFVWIFMMLLGYVLLFSASSYVANSNMGESTYYLRKQIISTIIGIVPMVLVIQLDYRGWKVFNKIIYGIAMASVVAITIPSLGIEVNGARRWLNLKVIQFQPAELVKLAIILLTAYLIAKCGTNTLKDWKNCLRIYMWTLFAAAAIMLITSNLSSAIIVCGISAVMLFIAGATWKFFAMIGGAGIGGLLCLLLAGATGGGGFRFSRIMVWLEPEKYSSDGGYQVLQGLYAIGSGGLFGKGLGNSSQKLGFVPEATNDMIFAIICEELGIFGAACIIFLFIFMIRRMRIIASNTKDLYGSMLVVGVMAHISIQVVLNIAVVTNSIPNTGVSLPFISYGGTSLLFLMLELGIVLSVSKRIKQIK